MVQAWQAACSPLGGAPLAQGEDTVRLSAMGIEVPESAFEPLGRAALRVLGRLPGGLTEHLLFAELPGRTFRQKAVQRLLRGPRSVRVHFVAEIGRAHV